MAVRKKPRRPKTSRMENIAERPAIKKSLLEVFADVEDGFRDERERADDIMDYWDAYNSVLSERQFYNGNSRIFVPIINNAVDARKTRFTNQIFPQAGRYIEVTTGEEKLPSATMALLESYVRRAKLRTQIVPALIVSGDVEGQYSIYVDWEKRERRVTRRVQKQPTVDFEGEEIDDLTEEPIDDLEEEVIIDAGPTVEIIADSDLLILPATANSVDDALADGGSVTIIRRWSKGALRKMAKDGSVNKENCDIVIRSMTREKRSPRHDTRKQLAEAAGIRADDGNIYCQGYETWTMLQVDGKTRLCRAYYAGDDILLGCTLCPYWCDLCPVISAAVSKMPGVMKGKSRIDAVLDMQIFANDAVNEGADTSHFSAMPITMTDPEKNPQIGSMILGLAAVWQTSPKDTQFAAFPDLWKTAFERVNAAEAKVFQTLGVNPAMIAQSNTGGKMNQAEVANQQQVDLLTTADAVTNLEEAILTPMVHRFAEYDAQFRDKPTTVRVYGEMGLRANMEEVEPLQLNKRFDYRWFGVEAARNAAQVQQQIAFLNVLKGIPPPMYEGYRLNAAPMLVQAVENVFGPRLGPLTFVDMKDQLSVDPNTENEMLVNGFDVAVHPLDNDAQHLQAHSTLAEGGQPGSNVQAHIMAHQQQIQAKTMAAAAQTMGGPQMPGAPGGGGPAPGVQPALPGGMKGPPGMIHDDQMPAAGAVGMPASM